jgi:hypothetical protein
MKFILPNTTKANYTRVTCCESGENFGDGTSPKLVLIRLFSMFILNRWSLIPDVHDGLVI